MSFILDALKKSENERQRQTGPGFAEVPLAQPRSRQPWWVFAVGALLLLNLLVLVFVVLRREPAAPAPAARLTAPASEPAASSPDQAPPAALPRDAIAASDRASRAAAPQPDTRAAVPPVRRPAATSTGTTLAEAAGVVDPYATNDPTLDYGDLDASAARVPAGPPIVQPLPQASSVADEPAEALPTINDLNLTGSATLPEMHLDIHVFAPVPAERFVFINMRKYVEGQKLQEGPVVERITRDGVVLNQHGLRFVLPSQ